MKVKISKGLRGYYWVTVTPRGIVNTFLSLPDALRYAHNMPDVPTLLNKFNDGSISPIYRRNKYLFAVSISNGSINENS